VFGGLSPSPGGPPAMPTPANATTTHTTNTIGIAFAFGMTLPSRRDIFR
jgi:hypothetical protein